MNELIVIGAGAAGLLAAGTAAREGIQTLLLEKNPKVGRKIVITGKGRCNVTNNCDEKTFIDHIVTNPRFMYAAIKAFPPPKLMELVEAQGTKLKTERGARVFPVSDKSFDIVDALLKYVKTGGVKIRFDTPIERITRTEKGFTIVSGSESFETRALIVATGGLSYPVTGSTGDGHRMLKQLGLTVTDCCPALIPLTSNDEICRELMGLSLRNVRVTLSAEGKKLYQELGEMLFTHFGLSGPLVLSASSYLQAYLRKQQLKAAQAEAVLHIDLKPALSRETLDLRVQKDLEKYHTSYMRGALSDLLPHRMIAWVLSRAGIDPGKRAADLTKKERMRLLDTLKDFCISISGTRPMEEAIITAGGVDVSQITPKTMMVKQIPGLFAAGELLDIDGLTGGFNLQCAFASGFAAGKGAAAFLNETTT